MNDGGRAFPGPPQFTRDGSTQHFYEGSYGMSLRDWFAGQALASGKFTAIDGTAKRCYDQADAMIKERERGV